MLDSQALAGVRGALLDIDGTLLVHDQALPGARGFLQRLRSAGIGFRLTTNTTRRSRAATAAAVRAAGLEVPDELVLQPAVLARRRILESGLLRAGLLLPAEACVDLAGVVSDETDPDWVVVADIGQGFSYDRMNTAFRWIRGGARLLALHKNPCWDAGAGPVLDAGAFVAALEFATGAVAEVVGKPSPEFFALALADLGLPPEQVLVVGDDPATDIAGGAAAGCRTALVQTGVYRGESQVLRCRPDLLLESVAQLFA